MAIGSTIRITVTAAAGRALATFAAVRAAVARLARSTASAGLAAGKAVAPFALVAGKVTLIASAAAAATGVLGNLLGAIQLIAPAAAAGGLALLGVKLALNGVSDALSAGLDGDVEKFEKALKKLEPAAAATVRMLVKLRDEWKPIQQRFQGEVFAGAAAELESLSRFIKPVAETWLPRLAMRFAEVRNQLADVISAFAASGKLEGVWRNVHVAVSNLLDVLKPLATAFLNILEVAAPKFAVLTGHIRDLAIAFGDWVQKSKDSGKLTGWLNTAMETGGKLWEVMKNLATTVSGIFGATSEGGDDFLDSLVKWTADLSNWVNSGDGQKIIGVLSQIVTFLAQMSPLLGLWLDYITAIAKAFQWLWGVATSAAGGIASGVGSVVDWLKQAWSWVTNLGNSFGWIGGIVGMLNGLASAARSVADAVRAAVGAGKNSSITPISSGKGTLKGHASGGYPRGLTWVGEHGPELADFGAQGRVYSAGQSRRMAGQPAAATTVTVTPVVAAGADRGVADLLNTLMNAGLLRWELNRSNRVVPV